MDPIKDPKNDPVDAAKLEIGLIFLSEFGKIILERDRLREEVKRLKAGRLTSEEFQNLCHNLHECPAGHAGPPCSREQFENGCVEFQNLLFGPKEEKSNG